ncbi:lanthionine synthetase C family protein [Streptomyces sp. HU2014]|uniref:lanthionine synthetase C family protein n=1 Tax=Streptomyces sp. HU2014 TaxID=2939414 RepID=UPI00200C0934|nr:lanthionine synthetase C family protein [Streptomyces sp. HU2014]UQI45411.1 lanthionine synthetase C family protein [Streptomyces sp. HU2014]
MPESTTTWSAVLRDREAAEALELVTALTGRPRRVPARVHPDLADGGPGLVLAFRQLDRCRPGEGWGGMAEGYLAATAEGAARLGGPDAAPGLFGGLAGLAFAAWALSPGAPFHPAAHEHVVERAAVRARALGADPHGPPARAFDVISGVTGTGAYLLCRHEEPAARAALCEVLTALVALSGADRAGTPHLFTPPEALNDPARRARSPHGAVDCGAAHGIAGPLALLSLALTEGVTVAGQRAAVARLAERLAGHRSDDAQGPDWPALVPLPPPGGPTPARPAAAPASWCRGAPGIARALWHAGTALDDAPLRALAIQALKAVLRRPIRDGTGLCHGLAGLLQITVRFAHDTGDPELAGAAAALADASATRLRTSAAGPGFLDGAAGAVLAFLSAATDVPPDWDRVLLLS